MPTHDTTHIPEGWKETTLGEVAIINVGFVGKVSESISNKEEGIPMITTKNIRGGNIDLSDVYFVDRCFHEKNKKSSLKRGDIVVARHGDEDNGKAAMLNKDTELNCMNVIVVRPIQEIANGNFVLQFMSSKNYLTQVQGLAGGSVQKVINTKQLGEVKILLPPLPEQRAIADILSSFDAKIDLLREQNETLEKTAQTIFHEWFGRYSVESPGELPEGWRIFRLSEIVEIISGYAYKGADLVENSKHALVTLKSFDRDGGFQTRGFKPFTGNPKDSHEVKTGDLIVAHTDLTQDAAVLGNPAFIFENGGFERMFITMDLVKVISLYKEINNSFLYYMMKTKEFKGHCVGYSNGTTVLHLSKKAIPEYNLILPENFSKIESLSKTLDSFTKKISDNNLQINSLSKTRDTLLPKLMSGEVRVEC